MPRGRGRPSLRERTKHLRKVFGERLQSCREQAGLSIEDVAARTDFSPKHLREMEEGLRPIPAEWLSDLAKILGVTTNHFLGEQKVLLEYVA